MLRACPGTGGYRMKLMVIDGNSLINRAFYGIRMLTTKDGQPTNAVYGFVNILLKLLDEEKPDALCVTFDRKAPTFRHLAYEGYKAQRKGMPRAIWPPRVNAVRQKPTPSQTKTWAFQVFFFSSGTGENS